jgi:hypothetical protein
LFGARFVVIYLEPIASDGITLTTNAARTTLLLDGEPLPWADWAYEFRENMPKQLAEFVKENAAGSSAKDHVKSIKERLKGIMDLYKVSRYRPAPQGNYLSDKSSAISAGLFSGSGRTLKGGRGAGRSIGTTSKGTRDGEIGDIYYLFEKKDGVSSDKIQSDPFPIVNWVSVKDGTRVENDMEDKAAKYLSNQNTLLVNADFRVFQDMIKRLCAEKDTVRGINIENVVEEVVRTWFEQALVETVIGIQQLKGSKEWGPDEIDSALSEEALTSTVMQRYHVYIACRRELGAKLGKELMAS